MNKLVGYTVLVLGTLAVLLISGLVNDGMKEIVHEAYGLQFEYLRKAEAIYPSNEDHFFTGHNGNELTFYMNKWFSDKGQSRLFIYKTTDTKENIYTLSVKAAQQKLKFTQRLKPMNREDMLGLITSLDDFHGMKLSQYNAESGWFGYIDDTVIIFVLFGVILFVLFLFLNSFVAYLGKKVSRKIEYIFPGVLVFLLAYWTTTDDFSIWYPYNTLLNDIRNFASVFIPFLLFRFVLFKTENLDFSDREVLKFFAIIIGTYFIGYALSQAGFAIDSGNYENLLMIEKHGPHPIITGMSISLATGNLLANLLRRMMKMRGSEKLLKKTELALGESSANLQSLQ